MKIEQDDDGEDERTMRIQHFMGLFELADERQNGHVCKNALIEAIKTDLKV